MKQVAETPENGSYLRPFVKILLALVACREKQVALAQTLLWELSEPYPASELFASEYAEALSLPVRTAC